MFVAFCFLFVITACSSEVQEATSISENAQVKQETLGESETKKQESLPSMEEADIDGVKVSVTNVVDGDTIDVNMPDGSEERIRLVLVDTPETKHPKIGVQPFGPEASSFTTSKLTGQEVMLEFDVQERDRYGRLLAYVWLGEELVNKKLIENGLARVAVFPPNTKYVDEFRSAQEKARQAELGIWSIENYVHEKGFNDETKGTSVQVSPPVGSHNTATSAQESTNPSSSCEGKIKGNKNSMIYHIPGGQHYERTTSNVQWFCSEDDAVNAGYRKSQN